MKKVVVTGRAGFIGSHMIELLLRKGYEVLADIVPSIEDPIKYHKSNVTGMVKTLEAARKYKVKKIYIVLHLLVMEFPMNIQHQKVQI